MAAARPLPPRRGLCGAGCARCALGGTASAFGHSALKFAQRPAWPGRGKGLQGPHSVGQPCGSTATRTCNAAPSKVGGEPEGSVDSDNQRAPLRPIVHLHTVLLAWLQLDPLSAADDQSNADSPAARRDIFRPLKKVRSAIAISAHRTGLAAIPSSQHATKDPLQKSTACAPIFAATTILVPHILHFVRQGEASSSPTPPIPACRQDGLRQQILLCAARDTRRLAPWCRDTNARYHKTSESFRE